jgi:DNA-binding MarR family transcriptional regulator
MTTPADPGRVTFEIVTDGCHLKVELRLDGVHPEVHEPFMDVVRRVLFDLAPAVEAPAPAPVTPVASSDVSEPETDTGGTRVTRRYGEVKAMVLAHLADAGGELNDPAGRIASTVAGRLKVTTGTVSGTIRRLTNDGLVTTVTTPGHRTVKVALTADGWDLAGRRPPRPVVTAKTPAVKEPKPPAPVFTNRLIAGTEEAPAQPGPDPAEQQQACRDRAADAIYVGGHR